MFYYIKMIPDELGRKATPSERMRKMARIAVVAADGKAAKKIIAEAINRGHEVVAFGRHDKNETGAKTYIKKELLSLMKEDLKGFDAVVDAFGAWTPETLPGHSTTLAHLCDILSGTDPPLDCRRRGLAVRESGAYGHAFRQSGFPRCVQAGGVGDGKSTGRAA